MANVKHELLKAPQVYALKTPGTYTDGATLTLRVSETGNKRWVQRITIEGKQRNIGRGAYPAVGLSAARQKARDNAKAIRDGRNPIEEKRLARKQAKERAATKTFREIALEVIENKRGAWSVPKTEQRWNNTLLNYAVPVIGNKRPRDITTDDILHPRTCMARQTRYGRPTPPINLNRLHLRHGKGMVRQRPR